MHSARSCGRRPTVVTHSNAHDRSQDCGVSAALALLHSSHFVGVIRRRRHRGQLPTRIALDLLPARDDNRRVIELTEPQVWVLIGVFAAALFALIGIITTNFGYGTLNWPHL